MSTFRRFGQTALREGSLRASAITLTPSAQVDRGSAAGVLRTAFPNVELASRRSHSSELPTLPIRTTLVAKTHRGNRIAGAPRGGPKTPPRPLPTTNRAASTPLTHPCQRGSRPARNVNSEVAPTRTAANRSAIGRSINSSARAKAVLAPAGGLWHCAPPGRARGSPGVAPYLPSVLTLVYRPPVRRAIVVGSSCQWPL